MDGFDPKWRDPEHYILGITKAIWEDREIGSLTRYYGEDLVVRSPASVVKGNRGIIAATMATLAEFPDRQLYGEDVIWCAAKPLPGFLSSHRLICTATHSHPGVYGAPTRRRLHYRILADCYCAEDAVQDEWLVRDQAAIVLQMGGDLEAWTRDLIAREGGPEACVKPYTPARDLPGPYTGRGNKSATADELASILRGIMDADFSVIPCSYDRACALHYPRHEHAHGTDAADRFWLGLRAALPSARFEVHHQMGSDDGMLGARAAVRWSLTGPHDGWGRFGTPTGAELHVMGITHAEFGPRGLRREFTLIDETAIWKQILLASGRV
ncbi:nuclear transport factor 2 family protein [Litoreibacter ponti]|nr:nuclear transport factor 2 family protein [Litoreibacter ponti]